MEQQNRQPIQEKTNRKSFFRTHWKFISIAALLAVVVAVGGILLFKAVQAPPMEMRRVALCDLNADGGCNAIDQDLFQQAFGKKVGEVGYRLSADVNADGVVNVRDQQVLFPVTSPAPSPQVLDTSSWQTYRNDELGFEFRYPDDWGVEEYAPGALRLTGMLPLTSERLPYIGISSYDRTRSGISYCEAYPEHQGRCEKFINGNVSGTIEWFEDYPTHAIALVDLSDQVTLAVSMGDIGKFAKIPDEIKRFFRTFLSTFRFVE